MFKLYKWLAYYIVKPCKKFQHFIKWFSILFSSTKTNSRRKTEKKIEKRKKPTHLGPQAQLTFPAAQPAASSCRLPRRGKQLAGSHADAGGSSLHAWRPPRRPYRARETPWTTTSLSLSQSPAPLPPPRLFFVPRTLAESAVVHRRGHH